MKKDFLIVVSILLAAAGISLGIAALTLPPKVAFLSPSPIASPLPSAGAVALLPYTVIDTKAHSSADYTQGLHYENGILYEGTGQYGRSLVRASRFTSGQLIAEVPLGPEYFGEGITVVDDRLLQLTWKEGRGFIYDKATLRKAGEFTYQGEGWGLAYDGERVIMSDGSAELRFLHPDSLAEIGRLTVVAEGVPLARLNELEYARGRLYANIWQTDRIAEIDLSTGKVTAWLDLERLYPATERAPDAEVLNGIAYDAGNELFLITGKYWPTLFLLKVGEPVGDSAS